MLKKNTTAQNELQNNMRVKIGEDALDMGEQYDDDEDDTDNVNIANS